MMPRTTPLHHPTHYARGPSVDTAAAALVLYVQDDGQGIDCNAAWRTFTGRDAADSSGFGWLDSVHPDDRQRVLTTWQQRDREADVLHLCFCLQRADGQLRDMSMDVASPHNRDDGAYIGIAVDVTEQLLAQRALHESADRHAFLDRLSETTRGLASASDIMGVTARMLGEHLGATRCAYADVERDNDRFTIRNDWSVSGAGSSVGAYSLDLFGPLAANNLRQGHRLVVRDVDCELSEESGGRMFNAIGIKAIVTAPLVKKDRLVAMMAVHQSAPRDWSEDDIALIADVVDRCWAHIERVRDAEILREQDQRKDEFLATLAHELRNPLAPMRYATALLRMAEDPVVATRARDIIDRQVGQMTRLIDDLLDLSRVNRGLVDLKIERVALNDLMRQAVEAAAPAVSSAHHRLQVRLPEQEAWLNADPTRVLQMVGNLLSNAVKYTPDGGEICIQAELHGDRVAITVADNGMGIPSGDLGKLFNMFTQLPHTARSAKGGLGIGLSLVKTLVALHGGTVSVRSEGLDRGATFTIELPLAIEQQPPGDADEASVLKPGGSAVGRRVLVVEDNDDGRASLVLLLELLGFSVAAAATGPDAVQEAQRFHPEIVVLDIGLPGFDGYEVARRLRADPALSTAKLLALTGWGAALDREKTQRAGFEAHLTKPIEPRELQECLANWL